MKRPVIGITTDYNDKLSSYDSPYGYATSVEKAGGLPILLPYRADLSLIPQYLNLIDGIVFSGGDDLDPESWGETYHPKTSPVDPLREKFERALMIEVERRRMPTLGICMGSQLMNVLRGGSLYQFLPDLPRSNSIEHRKIGAEASSRSLDTRNRHAVWLTADSLISKAIGDTKLIVNTSHKQSVRELGQGLKIIATAPDGVIEGIADPSMPLFVGVQWHPEQLREEREHLAIFELLVDRAKATKEHSATIDRYLGFNGAEGVETARAVLSFDLPCINCNYNLRGLAASGQCPECGAKVSGTIWTEDDVTNSERSALLRQSMLEPIAQKLGCKVDALFFILDALNSAATDNIRHLRPRFTATQICAAGRSLGGEYFNDGKEMVEVLDDWGIRSSEDIGRMIEAMAGAGLFRADVVPPSRDFENLFRLCDFLDRQF